MASDLNYYPGSTGVNIAAGALPRHMILRDGLQLADVVSLGLALVLGLAAGTAISPNAAPAFSALTEMHLSLLDAALTAFVMTVGHAALSFFDVYRSEGSLLSTPRTIRAAAVVAVWAALTSAAAFGLGYPWLTASAATALVLSAVSGVVASRSICSLVCRMRRRSTWGRRNILIAGTGKAALRFAEALESGPESDSRVIGFCDDTWPGMERFRGSGHQVVCDPKNFTSFVRMHVIDELVIALPLAVLQRHRDHLLGTCAARGIPVRFLAVAFGELHPTGFAPAETASDVVMSVANGVMDGWTAIAKRTLDICVASTLLLFALPVCLLVALVVKVSSSGPIFFVQERVGFNGRRFPMLKFRTMIENAEKLFGEVEHLNESDGPTFKIEKDPRLTPFGPILRKASLDELPQLWNIVAGHMSLVGPRPLPVRDVEGFETDEYDRRFSVRPGLTGLWQVSGRCSVPFERWMDLDLHYVDQWSLALDLEILMKTIPAVLSGRGAV